MKFCCVCRKRKISGSTVAFHNFPRNKKLLKSWYQATGLTSRPDPSARVCSEHFTERDYTKSSDGVSKGKLSSKLLLPTAVPSQNLRSKASNTKVPHPSPTVPSKMEQLEDIIKQCADPNSIEISHDQETHTITIRYQPNPIPKQTDRRSKRVCSRCNAILQLADFETHTKSCLGGKLKPFQCATCQACYETVTELRVHKCNPLEPDGTERREQLELLTKAITGKEYDSDSDAVEVVGEEEEVQPNKQCNECDRFIPVSRMQLHYQKFHADCGVAPFRCRLCASQFEFCEDLSKHLKSHTAKQLRSLRNRKPTGIPYDSDGLTCYECYLCGNVFSSEESVRVHQGTHLGDNIRCPVCCKYFEQKFDFLKHLASH